uniref:Uncharacterized protein n=1 Tax=Caenorhabditis japonica TaxID=281687 RepID=A0A8R1ILE3_CAEJA
MTTYVKQEKNNGFELDDVCDFEIYFDSWNDEHFGDKVDRNDHEADTDSDNDLELENGCGTDPEVVKYYDLAVIDVPELGLGSFGDEKADYDLVVANPHPLQSTNAYELTKTYSMSWKFKLEGHTPQ